MELEELLSLVPQYDQLVQRLDQDKGADKSKDYLKQYNVDSHAIYDKTKRPDKSVQLDQGETQNIPVARLGLPLQKRIVNMAKNFLCGNPVELSATAEDNQQKDLLSVLKKSWRDQKLDYDNKAIAGRLFSECEVAELWYSEPLVTGINDTYWAGTPFEGSKFKLRMKVISPALGDTLYPIYNAAGDLIAFGRGYSVQVGDKKEEHFDLYTEANIITGLKAEGGSWQTTSVVNPVRKIPVIYYSQDKPEWWDVQALIERYEEVLSNLADTNDYFASPMIVANGKIKSFAQKGERGKILEMEGVADVKYLEWNQMPEAIKLELETILGQIYDLTDTPNISLEQMKALGTYSGIALKMLFLGAHLKASDKEENFGKGIQRRINYMLSALGVINTAYQEVASLLSVQPKFTYYLPKNELEIVTMLETSVMGGILSQQTAVTLHPFVENPDTELKLVQNEAATRAKQQSQGNPFSV